MFFKGYEKRLAEFLAKYYEGFIDITTEDAKTEVLFGAVSPDLHELVKQCLWSESDCLHEQFWKSKMTRNVLCWEFSPSKRLMENAAKNLRLVFGKKTFTLIFWSIFELFYSLYRIDFETDQAVPFLDIGGGIALQIYLYDPYATVLTTWDKSYSFDMGPGYSYKVGLSTKKLEDKTGFTGCIETGKEELDCYELPFLIEVKLMWFQGSSILWQRLWPHAVCEWVLLGRRDCKIWLSDSHPNLLS